MQLQYSDTRKEITITIPAALEVQIAAIIQQFTPAAEFDLVHIDLRDESIEEVICYNRSFRVCSFGGAIAWNMYLAIKKLVPEIETPVEMMGVEELKEILKRS
ncbi:MAG: hypothetical protein JNM22_05525 [Saprospiraceae bacterium]|nr:hypothetical protein [Saprospiraceae bacterium]